MLACDMNVIEVLATARPHAANIGRSNTGSGVGIEAFGSPIAAQTIRPPFTTSFGLTPKVFVGHKDDVGDLAGLE
jgi:hypothetical protein